MTMEPWNLRVDDSRKEDTVATFIIFCEDEVSEPIYLRSFSVPGKVKITAVADQKQTWVNLSNAIADCIKNDLLEPYNGSYRIKAGTTTNIWSAYDRDMENEIVDENVTTKDSIFSTAIQTSYNIGIKVAWSNDAFELWILLHFESVPHDTRLHRNYIYRRLTQIMKTIPNQSQEMSRITSSAAFDYKIHFKKRTNFTLHVLPLLTPERRNVALANAISLENNFNEHTLYHERNPCTMVHRLVAELIAFQ